MIWQMCVSNTFNLSSSEFNLVDRSIIVPSFHLNFFFYHNPSFLHTFVADKVKKTNNTETE